MLLSFSRGLHAIFRNHQIFHLLFDPRSLHFPFFCRGRKFLLSVLRPHGAAAWWNSWVETWFFIWVLLRWPTLNSLTYFFEEAWCRTCYSWALVCSVSRETSLMVVFVVPLSPRLVGNLLKTSTVSHSICNLQGSSQGCIGYMLMKCLMDWIALAITLSAHKKRGCWNSEEP